LNADIKAKKVRDGYVLHVANQTETLSIDWKSMLEEN
jgi:hypothetical protein